MIIILAIVTVSEGFSLDAVGTALAKMSKDLRSPVEGTWFVVTERPMPAITRGLEPLIGPEGSVILMNVHEAPTTGWMDARLWRWFQYWRSA